MKFDEIETKSAQEHFEDMCLVIEKVDIIEEAKVNPSCQARQRRSVCKSLVDGVWNGPGIQQVSQ